MLILPIPIRAAYRDRSRRPVALVGSKSFGSLRRFGFGLGKELARLLSLRRALSGCTSASQLQNPSVHTLLELQRLPLTSPPPILLCYFLHLSTRFSTTRSFLFCYPALLTCPRRRSALLLLSNTLRSSSNGLTQTTSRYWSRRVVHRTS